MEASEKMKSKQERKTAKMTFHEFGKENEKMIVLLHPLGVWWDVFEYVIPILQKDYRVIIPAVPGHDPDRPYSSFTSVEEIASEIEGWLIAKRYGTVDCLYGCSMGGALVSRILADGLIKAKCAVMDGGITPYRLPKALTYAIGVRDFCMTELGKHSDIRFLKSVFDPDKYSEGDLLYVKKVLHSMSAKTIWRGFYSCNNYSMPDGIVETDCIVYYWYGEQEKKARKSDIEYIGSKFRNVRFVENKGQDHAEFFTLHPKEFCSALKMTIDGVT